MRMWFGYYATAYALVLLIACCAIPSWGQWYTASLAHREQTDAFFRGELALSHNPTDLGFDLCWSEGGVHQVWGLGIPLWRLPFEALARCLGQPAFPDRISLGAFIALVAYVVLSSWLMPILRQRPSSLTQDVRAASTPGTSSVKRAAWNRCTELVVALGAMMLSLSFAPLINLLRSNMQIYEEVLVYVYFCGIILAYGVIALAQNPTWRRFMWLCVLAGLGGLVRPTLVFYGVATVIIGAAVMILDSSPRYRESQCDEIERLRMPRSIARGLLIGSCLFGLGGGLLFLTNRLRFGSGWEFGHSLNLQPESLLASVYSTRFDYPFMQTSLVEAARELFGALFQTGHLNHGSHLTETFIGQSPIFRWRQFTFSTYDLSYAACIGFAWLLGMHLLWTRLCSPHQNIAQSEEGQDFSAVPLLLIMWSILASVPLMVFYMRAPVITDRYMLDFSPAFTVAIIGSWWWLVQGVSRWMQRPGRIQILLLFALVGWQSSEIAWGRNEFGVRLPITQSELLERGGKRTHTYKSLPSEYRIGSPMGIWGILYDGSGWDEISGRLSVCAIFFVDNPTFLELELAIAPGKNVDQIAVACIRAKVGLEFLDRQSILRSKDGWIVRFAGPKQHRYQNGLQPVFLATVSPGELDKFVNTPTPWILKRISWRPNAS
jgi:hypothetical protein